MAKSPDDVISRDTSKAMPEQQASIQVEALPSVEAKLSDITPKGVKQAEQRDSLILLSAESNDRRAAQSPVTPIQSVRPMSAVIKSYFENDTTDSEDDEPVVSKANSIRVVQPSFVHHSPSRISRVSRISSARSSGQDRPISPLSERITEATEDSTLLDEAEMAGQSFKKPYVVGRTDPSAINEETAPFVKPGDRKLTLLEGLRLNPLTEKDIATIHRAISAPARPRTHLSGRRVRIRPADLVTRSPNGNSQSFRETIVTTPYPNLDEMDKTRADDKLEFRGHKSRDIRDDRFPSIDHAEVLFLDLTLANHLGARVALEIQIADKGVFDDEILFRQIRKAYYQRLLGTSRLPFSLIRCVAYAKASPLAQCDFKMAEFIRYFRTPRVGRGRKSWVIWLRRRSQQLTHMHEDQHLSTQPSSAGSRTADKRLSVHSDTTSTFNFAFLPPSLVPRLPFFSREARIPAATAMATATTRTDSENERAIIEIELGHEFSLGFLALLFFCTFLCSVISTVVWVLFGVPGSRLAMKSEVITWAVASNGKTSWQADAQDRILTGLVLGLFVALLGSIVNSGLAVGAYVFL